MKFSENYYKCHFPEWSRSYCNYDVLKRLAKDMRTNASNIDEKQKQEFDAVIKGNINTVENFTVQNLFLIKKKLHEIWKLFQSSSEEDEIFGANVYELDEHEIRYLLVASREQYEALQRLQTFARINSLAFSRLLEKIKCVSDKSSSDLHPKLQKSLFFHQTGILTLLNQLENVFEEMHNAIRRSGSVGKSSFLLAGLFESKSPAPIDIRRMHESIHQDEPQPLLEFFNALTHGQQSSTQSLEQQIGLAIRYALMCHSFKCVQQLILFLGDQANLAHSDNTFIHEVLQAVGRQNSVTKSDGNFGSTSTDIIQLSPFFLERLLGESNAGQTVSLRKTDALGRLPLHYAALYGLSAEFRILLQNMEQWDDFETEIWRCLTFQDMEGNTPLELAVAAGHSDVFNDIMKYETSASETKSLRLANNTMYRNCLEIAVASGNDEFVRLLLSSHIGYANIWRASETVLYMASRLGHTKIVKILIDHLSDEQLKANEPEPVYQRTPLSIACINGFEDIVKLLLEAGANELHRDLQGLTPKEQSVYRGHVTVADIFKDGCPPPEQKHQKAASRSFKNSVRDLRNSLQDGDSIVMVNLGSFDLTKKTVPVDLSPTSARICSFNLEESRYSVDINMCDREDVSYSINLPCLEDSKNKPLTFLSKDPDNIKLEFKVSRAVTDMCEEGTLVGTAIAILAGAQRKFGPGLDSIIRDFTVPIQSVSTHKYMGTITFTYTIVKPSKHLAALESDIRSVWSDTDEIKVVGHRGFGQNVRACDYLQIGENTLQSFETAVEVGAKWVEFDVQMTKDLVPVVHHDFLVAETGIDAQLHEIKLNQLTYLTNKPPQTAPVDSATSGEFVGHPGGRRTRMNRSRSLNKEPELYTNELANRMKNTLIYSTRGFKSNTMGSHIKEPFVTLEQLLRSLPASLAFDVEIKYPTIFDRDEWQLAPVTIELNIFVDGILDIIFEHIGDRNIIISSFSPEICMFVSLKQQKYPVVFLTRAGYSRLWDERARSLREAVYFAHSWNLLGIVTLCNSIITCPGLIGYIKSKEMVLWSYGSRNNAPENAKLQAEAGLDAIVVDRFALISKVFEDK